MRRIPLFMLICLLLAACSIQEQPARTLTTTVPATGISSLMLNVNIGSVTVTPSADSIVHISVGLKHSNSFFGIFSMGGNDAIKAATLSHESADGVLKLGLRYPANTDAGGVSEYWTLAIPAGMHVSSGMNVGKLQVSGITGGVEANLNVGKVTLNVPSGDVKISANVGKINAEANLSSYGSVNLIAGVGDAQLRIDGASAGTHEKSGSGARVSYQGSGKNTLSLSVSTGKVSLDLKGK